MSPDGTYTLGELADLADVTPRTVRYYIAQGLLPSPLGAGPGARYDEDHLRRLRLIRRLQGGHLPLAEIRKRLATMTPDEIEATVASQPEPEPDSALEYLDRLLGDRAGQELRPAVLMRSIAPAEAWDASPSSPAPLSNEPVQAIERSQWDRIHLDPDVELHVRRPLSRIQNKRVERLVELARQILKEDPS